MPKKVQKRERKKKVKLGDNKRKRFLKKWQNWDLKMVNFSNHQLRI